MADSIPKFHDAAERSPIGGWHYFYDPADGGTMFKKFSPDDVIDEVVRYRTINGLPTSDRSAVEAEIWRYYCARQPERCGLATGTESVVMLPRNQKPEFFGPIIWRFLNLAATRFEETGRDYFLATVGQIYNLMSCSDCRASWARILADHSPASIRTTLEACRWVNLVHNAVNLEVGHAAFSYEQMVTEYGAPLP